MNDVKNQDEVRELQQHEPSGVDTRTLLATASGLVALVLASLLIVSAMTDHFDARSNGGEGAAQRRAAQDGPAASPPLDVNQQVHRLRYENEQRRLLESYGWVDRNNRIARIPVQRAMQLTAAGRRAAP